MNISEAELRPKKIIIFYSSIGEGHYSAARTIEREIKELSPKSSVILKDIRGFMNPVKRRIDKKLYWFVANNLPNTFDVLFHAMQERGKSAASLSSLAQDYQEEKLLAFVKASAPDVILATHYGSAQILGVMREKLLLPEVTIGWLHTDFFVGYLPRISKLIDQTFLAHSELGKQWLRAGVPLDKISISGMPVQRASEDKNSEQKFLRDLDLNPDIPMILLTSGKEGVGDYQLIISSIAENYKNKIQIVAVCGKNNRLKKQLLNFAPNLPTHVRLKVLGFISHQEIMILMRAARLLISKAGGITPPEAFSVGLPTVLLDLISGHERENAAMFVNLGLAKMVSEQKETGKVVAELLSDDNQLKQMIEAQNNFNCDADFSRIADFALRGVTSKENSLLNFGAENGEPVANTRQIIKQLDAEIPADIEILLSYSTSILPEKISHENPFGHIAIRIGQTIYSAHYKADQKTDNLFLQHFGLDDYLYGTHIESPTQIHTNTYGLAYGRETLGLRVAGIPQERVQAMLNEVNQIETRYKNNTTHWNKYTYNCADVVALILKAGGYDPFRLSNRFGLPTIPLDVFDNVLAIFTKYSALRKHLVLYQKVPNAKALYRFSHFPLSPWQPMRTVKYIVNNKGTATDFPVSKTIIALNDQLFIENLQNNLSLLPYNIYKKKYRNYLATFSALVTDARKHMRVV